jgi:uncharacterized DUF497 family protein
MDLVIDALIIEDDRPEHIRKHGVTVDEVIEVISGSYVFFKGKFDRWVLIGQSEQGKFLTIVVGERETPTTFGLVTARSAHRTERRFYNKIVEQEEVAEGGETHNDESNAA